MSELVVTLPGDHGPERRYIVEVLLREFLGLAFRCEVGGRDWVIAAGDRRLVIEDGFFGRVPDAYITAANVPTVTHELASRFATPIVGLFGRPTLEERAGEIRCGSDLFAAAFFMLTRWEEQAIDTRDAHRRFPAAASLAVRAGFLQRPIANEYAAWIAAALASLEIAIPASKRTFSIELSHDVDHPQRWTWRAAAITVGGDVLRRRDLGLAARTAGHVVRSRFGLERDPYDTFDWIMDVSDRAGVISQFNFMTGGATEHDPGHTYDSPWIRRLMATIARRGHRIGFHPSYLAYADSERFGRELGRLREMSPVPVTAGREHYLRFEVPRTWRIWNEHGLAVDSTVGYAEHEGFRAGTCYRYPVFDTIERRALELREQPLIAMDTTLVGYRKLSPAESSGTLAALRRVIEPYGGELTVLWHNSNLNEAPWPPYRDVYQDFVRGSVGA